MSHWLDAIRGVQNAVIGEFSESVLVYPVGDPWTPLAVPGVFDDEHTIAVLGEGATEVLYSSSGPLLTLRDSDHVGKRGDEIVIRGQRYHAVDARPDGQGMVVLVLEKVA